MRTAKVVARRLCRPLLFLAALLAWQAPAWASGDEGCNPSWKLAHRTLSGCDNSALLSPGNDTRVNLVWLMVDLRGGKPIPRARPAPDPDALFDWPSFVGRLSPPRPDAGGDSPYAEGEGSRCRSDAEGTAAFVEALQAATNIPESERTALVAARKDLRPSCTGESNRGEAITQVARQMHSATGKAFADYDAAARSFATAARAEQPWLRETARYMLGRVEMNRAQVDAFDEYGAPIDGHKPDPAVTMAAEKLLGDYLRAYPDGHYALSARGLLRRVYWLAGDTGKLARAYATLLGLDPAARGISDIDLAQEIDNKLLGRLAAADVQDPQLLAVLDLVKMRASDPPSTAQPLSTAALEAQRARFASNPALFDYLLAAHAFYIDHKPADVLRLIPDAARQASFSYLQFSRQMLRGMALEALGDRNARGFWRDLLGGATAPYQHEALELAIALHEERAHALDGLFAADSPVRNMTLRRILLTQSADAALLRRQATDPHAPPQERDGALFVLLYKEASRGPHGDFVHDVALVRPGAPSEGGFFDISTQPLPLGMFTTGANMGDYGCPTLIETEKRLASDPRDGKARLCVAEYVRLNGFDQSPFDAVPPADELGGAPSPFPGPPYSRLEAYRALIADASVTPADKAYALYRAINCYAPSGNNECGGPGVPVAQRKAWFRQLKKDYPASHWARDLAYYW